MQGIIEGHVPYILVNKEAIAKLRAVAKECDDVGVPQARRSSNHIQELFFPEIWYYHIDALHNTQLAEKKEEFSKISQFALLIVCNRFL